MLHATATGKLVIRTVGHSTHPLDTFVAMLKSNDVNYVFDVRTVPRSRHNPQFNIESLPNFLETAEVGYMHLPELGGMRKMRSDSPNAGWRNASFRGYADYMQTAEFKNGIHKLEDLAMKQTTAYMCSEAVWWRCHRALVSDYLKVKGWNVMHIMNVGKADEHPFTSAAKVMNGKLMYHE